MIEVKENKVFLFNTQVENQGFSFQIFADNQVDAYENLVRKLSLIVAELKDCINKAKAKASN